MIVWLVLGFAEEKAAAPTRGLRAENEMLDMLLLPRPIVEPSQVVLFENEHQIKIITPPDGDVSGMEIQYILDDTVPRWFFLSLRARKVCACCHPALCVGVRHLCEGKKYRSAIKPRPGVRTNTVRIRQSCRFVARLHANGYHDSDIVRARFICACPFPQ